MVKRLCGPCCMRSGPRAGCRQPASAEVPGGARGLQVRSAALYEEAMTADVLTWEAASNNRLILAGAGSPGRRTAAAGA